MPRTRFRTIWISDTHLGSSSAQAGELAFFLKHIECDWLYLVGDIVDMQRLRQRWYWPDDHNKVVRRILKLASRGVRVTYIPGNHDDAARPFARLDFGGIRVALNAAHVTADDRRLLVCHGDQYDLVVRHHRLLSAAGGVAYEFLLRVNRAWNAGRSALGLPYHSLSQAIKLKVKRACQFVSSFDHELVAEARRGRFAGVVCGHIHKPEARRARGGPGRGDDVAYYNGGDWVESCSALVEHDDGRVEVIDGRAFNAAVRRALASLPTSAEPHDEMDDWPDSACRSRCRTWRRRWSRRREARRDRIAAVRTGKSRRRALSHRPLPRARCCWSPTRGIPKSTEWCTPSPARCPNSRRLASAPRSCIRDSSAPSRRRDIEIRLALAGGEPVSAIAARVRPDFVHIATEGRSACAPGMLVHLDGRPFDELPHAVPALPPSLYGIRRH
ncbi:MAG: UDP-2,3-diacylglucosamine diphosphatase [Phycisphaerales bacterium]